MPAHIGHRSTVLELCTVRADPAFGSEKLQYLHLTHGAAVIPHDEGLLLVTADERFAAVSGSPAEIVELREILIGARAVPGEGIGAEVVEAVSAWDAGHLGTERVRPAAPWSLTDILPTQDLAAVPTAAPGLDAAALRLVVGDVLDDAALKAADRPNGGPWLPVHRELGALVVGPILSGPTPTLTWADVRFRRLAASPARPQLATLWETWSEHGTAYDVVPTVDAVRAAAARLLGWLAERPEILLTHQVLVPCAAGVSPSAHPVLPVPHGLMAQVSA